MIFIKNGTVDILVLLHKYFYSYSTINDGKIAYTKGFHNRHPNVDTVATPGYYFYIL